MSHLLKLTLSFAYGFLLITQCGVLADSYAPPPQTSKPSPSKFSTTPHVKKGESPQEHYKPLLKPELPVMFKPFEMPGVIGLQNGKWEGTDYLGYLSNNIGIDVEILKASNITDIPDVSTIKSRLETIFTKEGLVPHANVAEGPPLPFLHILLVIYPVDRDRYAIFGNARLFEQIQVIRKDFVPAGYWQGITWEIHDLSLASGQQLSEMVKEMADKITTTFVKRYQQYNPAKEGVPASQK